MTKTHQTTNIVLLGIGYQGTLPLMEMLALAAGEAGEEVRVLSSVSLARLGGTGMCHVRLGPSASPAIPAGEADLLVALEMSEVLRALPLARPGALAFISTYRRVPIAAGVSGQHYPPRAEIEQALQESGVIPFFIPEVLPGEEANDSRINTIILGVFTGYTNLLPRAALEHAIALRLPRFAEQNIATFSAGWEYGQQLYRKQPQYPLDNSQLLR